MSQTELEQPPLLEGELREIERALRGRLNAHRLSEQFIDRCMEEAVQRGLLEYLNARERGVAIGSRNAFVVNAAFCRAIDDLRREERHADGAALDALLDSDRLTEPATEEIAIDRVAAEQLREAIDSLSAEDRQALSLHYFERLTARKAAATLYCSERTYKRRLARALARLSRRLGIAAPEPGSDLAIELGVVAWVSIGGGRVAVSHGMPRFVSGLVDGAREGASWLGDRIRDTAGSLGASGAGEKLGALAGGPAAKVAGGCAGAAALCVAGVVAGPDIGRRATALLDGKDKPAQVRVETTRTPGAPTEAGESQTALAAPTASAKTGEGEDGGGAKPARSDARAERRQLEAQTSGIARAANESPPSSSSGGASAASATGTETVTVSPSQSASTSEETQAGQEFGAFK